MRAATHVTDWSVGAMLVGGFLLSLVFLWETVRKERAPTTYDPRHVDGGCAVSVGGDD